MLAIKYNQMQLSYINKIRNVCHTLVFDQIFYFDSTQDSKKNKRKYNLLYVAMPVMTSQILKSVDCTKTKTQIFREDISIHQGLLYLKKQFSNGGNL